MAYPHFHFCWYSHRYLGVILGIQFLIWTISGLYFSWTNIDEIHGDFQHRQPARLASHYNFISPNVILKNLDENVDSIHSMQLVSILGAPFYSLQYFSKGHLNKVLANAVSGEIRGAVAKDEAIQIATESFAGEPKVRSAEYITSTNGHHEYREKPLPAWGVTFEHPTNTTVYVSAEAGKVESFRNNKWRVFDFLWMGHTMDYQSRDNINNWLLRIFSLFGLLTVLSGFVLYGISTRRFRGKKTKYHTTATT